ncbi:spore germination protein [Cohnella hongkongensis]|uniref:Spore germination protein n=1 Tax=Cohnella hongkongensis TaxID=178337 RepID=A0ABV9FDK1_9BACL
MNFIGRYLPGGRKYRVSRLSNDGSARSEPEPLDPDLDRCESRIRQMFSLSPDLVVRKFVIRQTEAPAMLVYLDSLTDNNSVNRDVLLPLQTKQTGSGRELPLSSGQVSTVDEWAKVERIVLEGGSVLFLEGWTEAYALGTSGWPQRAIEDPQLETSLKGAHQGFIETGTQNIALLRRYLPHGQLKIKQKIVGRRGHTKVYVLYIADIVNPKLIQEMEKRIDAIDVDAVINTGELAELIEDSPASPFPQMLLTERPDTAASQLLQGRLVVIVDRSPSVIVAPITFTSFFQSVDDYSTRWSIATFLRLLRLFAFGIAAFLPAFYIAVTSFHYEVIPFKLLLTLGESRGQVPFPPFVEAILMEFTLEMLREAGVRLPAPVGQTVGIVGGIVIGQAIVQAGLVSNIMVVVVSFTAIASFILPNTDLVAAVRLIRFCLMVAAALFGFVGIIIGMMTMIAHLLALSSLDRPYFSPFGPIRFSDWKDSFMRVPLWMMNKRPMSASPVQVKRQGRMRPDSEGDSP